MHTLNSNMLNSEIQNPLTRQFRTTNAEKRATTDALHRSARPGGKSSTLEKLKVKCLQLFVPV